MTGQISSFWYGVFATLLGGVVTLVVSIALRRYVIRSDILNGRIEELCADVQSLAREGSRYWLMSAGSPGFLECEAIVFGLNHRVVAAVGYLSEEDPAFGDLTDIELFNLSDAVTGGDFQVAGRPSDISRYMLIEARASDMAIVIRRYQKRFWGRFL